MPRAMGQAGGQGDWRIDLLAGDGVAEPGGSAGRPWLGVYFKCAHAYVRVFRNAAGTAYQARCPRCARTIRFAVGAAGTERRTFEVSC